MNLKNLLKIIVLLLLTSSYYSIANDEQYNMDSLKLKYNCKDIKTIHKFVPLLTLITRPEKFNCNIVSTRGWLDKYSGHTPILYFNKEVRDNGWFEYSILLPINARDKVKRDGSEVFVTGLFLLAEINNSRPNSLGQIVELKKIKRGVLFAK